MKYETHVFEYELIDDGSFDTVVRVTDLDTDEVWDERFDPCTASYYRQADGSFTEQGFADFCDSLIES